MSSSDDDRHLLSLIVHELRSPMSVVTGYLRLVLQSPTIQLTESERKMISEANKSSGRVLQLVRELADLSSALESGDNARPGTALPVFTVWEDAIRTAAAPCDTTPFSCAPDDRAAEVLGDERRLQQAFAALLAASVRERGADHVESVGFVGEAGGARRVVIALGGPGLAARRDEIPRLREPFDWWRGGMGMVLPIARHIIESHGGDVWSLASDRPGGCAVSLPMRD